MSRIVFLHLSDIHVSGSWNASVNMHLSKLASTINYYTDVKEVVILLSGDLSFSGETNQFDLLGIYLTTLKSVIKENNPNARIRLFAIPGNHDMNHLKAQKEVSISEVFESVDSDSLLAEEQKILKNYYKFVSKLTDGYDYVLSPFLSFSRVEIDGLRIELSFINNALFSRINEEYKGRLFFPTNQISTLASHDCCGSIVFTVMHHDFSYYDDKTQIDLQNLVYSRSSVVFVGHNHVVDSEVVEKNTAKTLFVRGGKLGNNTNWDSSEFNVVCLDTSSLKTELTKFIWDGKNNTYLPCEDPVIDFTSWKYTAERIQCNKEFLNTLLFDNNFQQLGSLEEYFVFPRLSPEDSASMDPDILDFDSLLEKIKTTKRIDISGDSQSGKTSLIRMLYKCFVETPGFFPLIIDSDTLSSFSNTSELLVHAIKEQYEGSHAFDYYMQIPKGKKVLLIDDFDKTKERAKLSLSKDLFAFFEYSITTNSGNSGFDIIERVTNSSLFSEKVKKYNLESFYKDKRIELIESIIRKKQHDFDQNTLKSQVMKVEDAISGKNRFILFTPYFIICFTSLFLSESQIDVNDSNIFSRVFESEITRRINQQQLDRNMNAEIVVFLLSRIAYVIHFNKTYPIQFDDIEKSINGYNTEYSGHVNLHKFMKCVLAADLVRETDENYYYFPNEAYLAYFIAKEVIRLFIDSNNPKDIEYILRFSSTKINMDVLLFIVYLTQSSSIIEKLLQLSSAYTIDWPELDANHLPEYLYSEFDSPVIPENSTSELAKEKEKRIEQERRQAKELKSGRKTQVYKVYSYTDEDAERMVNQLFRAHSIMIALSKCIYSFSYMIKKNQKEKLVQELYELPNKVFFFWANSIDQNKIAILDGLKKQWEEYKPGEVFDREKFEKYIIDQSIMIYLNLCYEIAFRGSNSISRDSFELIDYRKKPSHHIIHAMITERSGNEEKFTSEMLELYKKKDNGFFEVSAKNIMIHGIIHMDKISTSNKQKLISTFFPNQKRTQKELLQASLQNQRKER